MPVKRIFLIAIAFMLAMPAAFSQTFHLLGGLGFNASRGSYRGLNFVLDRYNQTRQGQAGAAKVNAQMGNINLQTGIGWQFGLLVLPDEDEGLLLYTGINRIGRAGSTYATVTNINGGSDRRDVRFTANSVNFELGLGGRYDYYMGMVGGSLDLITTKAYTKINGGDYKNVMKDDAIGLSFFIDFSVSVSEYVAVGIKPYWQMVIIETDFTDLNRAINPATYSRDDYSDASSSTSNFGAQLQLRFIVGGG